MDLDLWERMILNFCDDEVEVMCILSGCPDLSDLEKEEQVQVNGPG